MHKLPNLMFTFTLPFFIALVFMLSAFTYTMGDMFRSSEKSVPQKTQKQVAMVLGDSDISPIMPVYVEGMAETEEVEINVETSETKNERPVTYSSVVMNADGTKTEIKGFEESGHAKVTIINYDIFGVKTSEETYSAEEYEARRSGSLRGATNDKMKITQDDLSEKILGMGYTYNPTKITMVKSDKGDVYKIAGWSEQKLFGVFKIKIPADLKINATDGKVEVSKSLLINLIDLISK